MSRILLRSAKDPFLAISAEASLARNVFAGNTGNMLFTQAMHRMLATPGTEVVADGLVPGRVELGPQTVDKINSEFDAYVIPLANAFRPAFTEQLARLTRLIRSLTIPVIITGVGAQTVPGATALPEAVRKPTAEFIAAVLDRSVKIGVRGEITAGCLAALGFGDQHVEVIGCPSLYAKGRDLVITRNDRGLTPDSPLAANLTLSQQKVAAIINRALDRYPKMIYVPQTSHELRLLLWGVPLSKATGAGVPASLDHPLYRQGRVRLFLDPIRWHAFLAEQEFAFGSRIHGNIAALTVGTPAHLLAFDSRTTELARFHAIPYSVARRTSPDTDPAELYDRSDFGAFNDRHAENFDRFVGFLEKNGLSHIFQPGQENPEFDRKLAEVDFPAPVRPVFGAGDQAVEQLLDRLRWLYQGAGVDAEREVGAYRPKPFGRLPDDARGRSRLHRRAARRVRGLARRLLPE